LYFYKHNNKAYWFDFMCKECHILRDKNRKHITNNQRSNYNKSEKWKIVSMNRAHRRRQIINNTKDNSINILFINNMINKQYNSCNICKELLVLSWVWKYHIDHIIPLSKWWFHQASNIQILCPLCNMRKSNK